MPRPHTESILDVLYMDAKIILRSFQWHQFQAQIRSESMGIFETIGRPESVGLLGHVLCWGPLWTWLGGYARPNHHIISSNRHIRVRVLFSLVIFFEKQTLHRYICGDKSLYINPGPPFLISSTVSISPLESSSWTPLVICFIHTCNYQIACLPFLSCVLRFTCRKSLLGEVNQVLLGW